jgi:glycosyltransferase involved in cell wall biosynthesis
LSPLFSVVIPTYNRSRMAAAAALSVLAQTEPDFECFIVDDGSTDDTERVLAVLPKDGRLKRLRMEKNGGQHACRNRAIRLARGEFVTFLDSDDLYLPGRLAAFRRAAEARPSVGFWFSNAYVHRFGRVIGRLFDPSRDIPQGKVPGWYAVGDKFLPYVTTNVAIRREAFDRYGVFREDLRILEDTELYARMLAGGLEVGSIPEPVAVRFLHADQITRDYERDFKEAVIALDAGAPPPETREARRREIAVEVATYLWKDARPGPARVFLLRELGESARALPIYRWTFLPPILLSGLRAARRAALSLRHAGQDSEVQRFIGSLADQASKL